MRIPADSSATADPLLTKEDSHRPQFPSRRELLAAATAVVATAVASAPAVATDAVPLTEGFFFVVNSKDDITARLFFLKSSWLPFFELTDQFYDPAAGDPYAKKKKLLQSFRSKSRTTGTSRWDVLYSEEIDPKYILPSASGAIDVLDPAGQTYLACSISPDLV
jgi:hypothetical protein